MKSRTVRGPLLALNLFVLAFTGCLGSARVVQRNQVGGILALSGWPDKSNKAAHEKMAAHCGPGNYTIVEESEAVVGSTTSGSRETTSVVGILLHTGSSETTNTTEPRLAYVCNSVASQYVPPPNPYGYAPASPAGMPAAPAAPMPAYPAGMPAGPVGPPPLPVAPAAYYYPPSAASAPASAYSFPPPPVYYPAANR